MSIGCGSGRRTSGRRMASWGRRAGWSAALAVLAGLLAMSIGIEPASALLRPGSSCSCSKCPPLTAPEGTGRGSSGGSSDANRQGMYQEPDLVPAMENSPAACVVRFLRANCGAHDAKLWVEYSQSRAYSWAPVAAKGVVHWGSYTTDLGWEHKTQYDMTAAVTAVINATVTLVDQRNATNDATVDVFDTATCGDDNSIQCTLSGMDGSRTIYKTKWTGGWYYNPGTFACNVPVVSVGSNVSDSNLAVKVYWQGIDPVTTAGWSESDSSGHVVKVISDSTYAFEFTRSSSVPKAGIATKITIWKGGSWDPTNYCWSGGSRWGEIDFNGEGTGKDASNWVVAKVRTYIGDSAKEETTYFYSERYTGADARTGQIKSLATPSDVARMKANGSTNVADYASLELDYDTTTGQLKSEAKNCSSCGGAGGDKTWYSYETSSYDPGTGAVDYSKWKQKTKTSTRTSSGTGGPGTERYTYYNYAGDVVHTQVLEYNSSDVKVNELQYHYAYDSDGRLTKSYEPSAWDGTTVAFNANGTVTYAAQATSGLVRQHEYYSESGDGDGLSGAYYTDTGGTVKFQVDATVNGAQALGPMTRWRGRFKASSTWYQFRVRFDAGTSNTLTLRVGTGSYKAAASPATVYVSTTSGAMYDVEIAYDCTSGTSKTATLEYWSGGTWVVVPQSCLYSGIGGLLKAEKVSNGDNNSGSVRTLVRYDYLVGMTPVPIVSRVTRYADTGADAAGAGAEVTKYTYPDGFMNDGGGSPVRRVTEVAVDRGASPAKFLKTEETYSTTTGQITSSVDYRLSAAGVETDYAYHTSGTDANNVGKLHTITVDPGGLALQTTYAYWSDGDLKSVQNSSGETTQYLQKVTNGVVIDGVTYDGVRESRVYAPWDSGSSQLCGVVNVTLSVPGGQTLSERTAAVGSWAGTAGVPDPGDTLVVMSRTDNIYPAKGQLDRTRTFCKYAYSNGVITGIDANTYYDTVYTYDAFGRAQGVTAPGGLITYTTYGWYEYDTTNHKFYQEIRTYSVYKDGNGKWNTVANVPVSATWADSEGQTVRSWTGSCTISASNDGPSGTESLTELSRTTYAHDWRGRSVSRQEYFDLTGLGLGDGGTLGTNYYQSTSDAYDNQDRLVRGTTTIGDITATVYDATGRAVEQWSGTDATGAGWNTPGGSGSPNNMVAVSKTFYDTAGDGTGTPQSLVTREEHLKPVATLTSWSSDRTYATFEYDSVGRQIWTKPAVGPWSKSDLDAAGRATASWMYANGSTTTALAKTATEYDAGGRVSAAKVYLANSGGTISSNYLKTSYFYDGAGRQCKVARSGGGFSKWVYDAMGRVTNEYVGSEEGSNTSPDRVTDDIVLTEACRQYDAASNVILESRYERNHNTTSKTGALSASWSRDDSQGYYVATWYDQANRVTDTCNYGNNDGTDMTARPEGGCPSGNSSDRIVASYAYGPAGRLEQVTDNKGVVTKTYYDVLGRTTYVVENYLGGTTYWTTDPSDPKSRNVDVNRITRMEYNAASQVTRRTAIDPAGDGTTTADNQVTRYVYSGELTGSVCPVASKSLLAGIIYPDSTDTVSGNAISGTDHVSVTYVAGGQVSTQRDQRSIVHLYTYDAAGRPLYDDVVNGTGSYPGWPSTGFVSDIKRIAMAYDTAGRVDTVSSCSDLGTTVVNQVQYVYDGLGQIAKVYQEHGGAVSTSTSLVTKYQYDDSLTGNEYVKGLRLKYVTYPDTDGSSSGRKVWRVYDGHNGIDDLIGRANKICKDNAGSAGDAIAAYSFNGVGTMVEKEYPAVSQKLSYHRQWDYSGSGSLATADHTYSGLDRFGRVTGQFWYRTTSGSEAPTLDTRYGYDNGSNRTYAEHKQYPGYSHMYGTYDALNRLKEFERGTLDSNKTDTTGFPTYRRQDWSLDQVGNWSAMADFGDAGSTQSSYYARTHSPSGSPAQTANEIVTSTVGAGGSAMGVPLDIKDGFTSDTSSLYEVVGGNSGNLTIGSGHLAANSLPQTRGSVSFATIVTGEKTRSSAGAIYTKIDFPSSGASKAGIAFGYQADGSYWLAALDPVNQQLELFQVTSTASYPAASTYRVAYSAVNNAITSGATIELQVYARARWIEVKARCANGTESRITYGLVKSSSPVSPGKIGHYTQSTGVTFDYLRARSTEARVDVLGRWDGGPAKLSVASNIATLGTTSELEDFEVPMIRRGLRLSGHQATFRVKAISGVGEIRYVLHAQDSDNYYVVKIPWDTGSSSNPSLALVINGQQESVVKTATSGVSWTTTDSYWLRVTVAGTGVKVDRSVNTTGDTPPTTWDATILDASTGSYLTWWNGGAVGLGLSSGKIEAAYMKWATGTGGSYTQTECTEDFRTTAETFTHDAAGNLLYDGVNMYAYDAWNRLAKVYRAYLASGTPTAGSQIGKIVYDALGRRVSKKVENMGDWSGGQGSTLTYNYYHDGQRILELRGPVNGGAYPLYQQYVWGQTYVDELAQIRMVQWWQDAYYYVLQDANYNVIGLYSGQRNFLTERYEYTPYGQRTTFGTDDWVMADVDGDGYVGTSDYNIIRAHYTMYPATWSQGDVNGDGQVSESDFNLLSANYNCSIPTTAPLTNPGWESRRSGMYGNYFVTPYGRCDFGHQGLLFDKEFGLYHNRARMYHPTLGRFIQRDPAGYVDGMSLYSYLGANPTVFADPWGLQSEPASPLDVDQQQKEILEVLCCCAREVVDRINRLFIDVYFRTPRQYLELSSININGTKVIMQSKIITEGGYREGNTVVIASDRTAEQAAAMLAHETYHVEFAAAQIAAEKAKLRKAAPNTSSYEINRQARITHEQTTWLQEEQMRLKCGIAPKYSNFRKWKDFPKEYDSMLKAYYGKMRIGLSDRLTLARLESTYKQTDIETLLARVAGIYGNIYGTPAGISVEEYDIVPAGAEIPVTGEWKCP